MIFRFLTCRLLFESTVIFLCFGLAYAQVDYVTVKRAEANISSPQALVVPPSQYFDGIDGEWSSWVVRAGDPPRDLRVLISTASSNSMVVLPEGCSTAAIGRPPLDCAETRGSLFNPNTSSSWIDRGIWTINGDGRVGLGASLGYNFSGNYGIDTLQLGSNGPKLPNQTISAFVDAAPMYLGVFGLGTEPVNYTTLGNSSTPSFFSSLKDQKLIPSLSWSYTAGAYYRLKQVLGQLVFGGYDTARFVSNTANFTMRADTDRDLIVAIRDITFSATSVASLLSEPIEAFIDSTDSNIWLPISACRAFEDAFSLTLDPASGLYLINATHRAALKAAKPKVSFILSNLLTGGNEISIELPYDAFDKEIKYPMVANTSFYFPLKRATSEDQYTLGRTFLQEAYLTVNHETNSFTVFQCAWSDATYSPNIVTIPGQSELKSPTPEAPSKVPKFESGLSKGAIAGIAIAAVLVFGLLMGFLAWLCVLQPRRKARIRALEEEVLEDLRKATIANDMMPTPMKPTTVQPARDVWELSSRSLPPDTLADAVRSPLLSELSSATWNTESNSYSPSMDSETLGSWTTIGRMGSLATTTGSPVAFRRQGRDGYRGLGELSELQGSDVAQLP